MITTGKYYSTLTGDERGNGKYSVELKKSIEQTGQLCIDNINQKVFSPIMMMGNIQSGKTRGFIGLMSLCFDNGFDVTIILTKCSTALVKQTVSRMMSEFEVFKTGNATVGDIVAQDIMPIKPLRTVVLPTGKGYIGGEYYFIDSDNEESENYDTMIIR